MIHYSCDLCKRPLDPQDDQRYVVKLEVYPALDPLPLDQEEEDCDHLEDLQDLLEQADDVVSQRLGDDVYQQLQFDLCPECRQKFLKNPLGRKAAAEQLDFSQN